MHGSCSGVPSQGCKDRGDGQRWPLARALAVWKTPCGKEKNKQRQDVKPSEWLPRPALVDLLRCRVGSVAAVQ